VKLTATKGGVSVPKSSSSRDARLRAADEGESLTDAAKERARISYKDLHIFTRQFSILMKANVPLLRIFEVLQTQAQNPKFRQILRDVQAALRQGGSLSEVLGQYPKIFSQMYLSMVHSGEVSGTLDKVLTRLSEFAEKESEIRSRVQAAVIYPLFLLLVGVGTIFVLLTFVMPRLMVVFDDLGTELPAITQVIMQTSEFCQAYWMWMLGGAGGIGIWLRTLGISEGQHKALDHFVIKLPILGQLVEKAEAANFLRSLELLYENGIPLFRAVSVATRTVSNRVVREALESVPGRLEGGATLASSLEEIPYMSSFVTNMISVGEETGQLGPAVREIATFYEQETDQVIKIATSLLEPFMILSIGVIVGFIVIAMLLPIFEIHALAQ